MSAGQIVAIRDQPKLPRARGSALLCVARRAGGSARVDVGESGCARLRFPRSTGAAVEAVLLNTAGGLTDGDRMVADIRVEDRAALTVTSQAAEKVYRSRGDAAEIVTTLRLADGAVLAWLPQETILFDRARLVRRTTAELVGSARLLACESLVFGRIARGETLGAGLIHDSWRISRDGRLVWADGFRLEGDIEAKLARPAVLDGRHALATAVYVGHDAEGWLAPARGWLDAPGVRAGVSCRSGVLVMRVIAEVLQTMRAVLAVALSRLRAAIGAGPPAMPVVWGC